MTKQEREAALTRKIRKSNELVQRARYKLSLPATKILLHLISRIDQKYTDFKSEEFVISDFCKLCGIEESGGNYEVLKEALSDLFTDSAKVWITNERGISFPIMWIEKPYIDEKSGKLMVKLDDDMKPYLLNLKANFTQYELVYTMRFRSRYSFRLYEIIKSYQFHDDVPFIKAFEIEEIKGLLGAETYDKFCDFNKRVLKISISEINKFTDKNLEVKEIKNGRKVMKLEFIISAKAGERLEAVNELIGRPKRKPRAKPAPAPTPKQEVDEKKVEDARKFLDYLRSRAAQNQ